MHRQRGTHLGRAVALTIAATTLLASQVAGATWSPPIQLDAAGLGSASRVVGLGGGLAVAVFLDDVETGKVQVRRTLNGGGTWAGPLTLATSSDHVPQIAGKGQKVDVVWVRAGRVRYARSTNGGASFADDVPLSPSGGQATNPDVARGPGGVVAVIWQAYATDDVTVRVSTDGGASFGAAKVVGEDGNAWDTAIAVGDGVIYAVHQNGDQIRLRRSLDDGASWDPATIVTSSSESMHLSVVASGGTAYVGFTGPHPDTGFTRVRYRGTSNKGATWSGARSIANAAWYTYDLELALSGGVLHAAFNRCYQDVEACYFPEVYHRQSADGITWGTAKRVSPSDAYEAFVAGVGVTGGDILVTWTGYSPDGVFVRRGS